MALVLVIAMTASIAVGGTLAYLTDRDSKANVFTVGDVSIELNENFQQGAELIPGVRVEKEATITNTGNNDAWVWMTVAVPSVLDDDEAELGSANVLHWNMPGCFWNGYHDDQKYIDTGIADGYLPAGSTGVAAEDSWINDNKASKQTIDGIDYNVYTFKYVGAIEPGETTNIGLSKVFLDENLDIDPDGQWYIVEKGVAKEVNWNSNTNGSPVVYVSAYAMQADGFDDVKAAYDAYNKQWTTAEGVNNGLEYGTPATLVSTADELADALADGKSVELTADITTDGFTSLTIADGADVTIGLNGHTLKNSVAGAAAIINEGSLTITGNGAIVNGTSDTARSHTIYNKGTLVIESGNIGTKDTAGAAVVNEGTATINGGTFASRQESSKGAGNAAYVFLNNAADAVMTINDATVSDQTHGLFGSYAGEIVVNGGNFTLTGDLACYITYTGGGKVIINGGTIDQQVGRNGHSFYGNAGYDQYVIDAGEVVINGGDINTIALGTL